MFFKGEVKTIALHYSATAHSNITGLDQPKGLISIEDVSVISEHGRSRLIYYDPKKPPIINPKKLKVDQLRSELNKRSKDTTGLKEDLTTRLAEVLAGNPAEMVKEDVHQ